MVPWLPLAAVALVAGGLVSKRRKGRAYRDIPTGSHHWPILGRLSALKAGRSGYLHHVWESLSDEAGDAPFIQFQTLGIRSVLAVSPEAGETMLKAKKFISKPEAGYNVFKFLGSDAPSIISETSAEEHARLRRGFSAFFCSENVDAVLASLAAEAQAACDDLAERARGCPPGGMAVNIADVADRTIGNVVRKVFFELDFEPDISCFNDQLDLMGELQVNPLGIPLLTRGLHIRAPRYRRNLRALRAMFERFLTDIYARPMPQDSTAFWACLRRAYPCAMTDAYEHERAIATCSIMYAAGLETTVNAIALTLAALALDQKSAARLEQELRAAGLLATEDDPAPRHPTIDDLSDLPFLNAVFHESLRLFPPAPSGSFRKLDAPLTACGVTLPEGTVVGMAPWALHHSTRVWGPDAKEWRPARWLEGRSMAALKKDGQGFKRWLPFSDGAQNCIGSRLATLETKVAVAMFVGRFRITADPAKLACKTPKELADTCTAYVTLRQKGGVHLRLEPRA